MSAVYYREEVRVMNYAIPATAVTKVEIIVSTRDLCAACTPTTIQKPAPAAA